MDKGKEEKEKERKVYSTRLDERDSHQLSSFSTGKITRSTFIVLGRGECVTRGRMFPPRMDPPSYKVLLSRSFFAFLFNPSRW